jgi:hypothetical protein
MSLKDEITLGKSLSHRSPETIEVGWLPPHFSPRCLKVRGPLPRRELLEVRQPVGDIGPAP